MTIRINQLRESDVRPLTVPYEGDVVRLHYRPAIYTAEFEDGIQSLIQSGRQIGAVAKGLADIIVDWDVEDDDGNPWPPTLENLRTINGQFIDAIVTAIMADIQKPRLPPSNGHSTEDLEPPTRRARR